MKEPNGATRNNGILKLFGRSLLFPANDEKIFVGIYLLLLPYVLGTLYLFFYLSDANFDTYSKLNGDSFFLLNWYIGYEVLACILLLLMIKHLFKKDKNLHLPTEKEV
jgi:hypothetical protein